MQALHHIQDDSIVSIMTDKLQKKPQSKPAWPVNDMAAVQVLYLSSSLHEVIS